ncbi:phage terminase small subunit [Bradyrhizobium sp. GM24.11]
MRCSALCAVGITAHHSAHCSCRVGINRGARPPSGDRPGPELHALAKLDRKPQLRIHMRGRKPKPPHLRLVDGTHRPDRHGDTQKIRDDVSAAAAAFGPLERPKYLKGFAREAWARFITPATWLDGSRSAAAVAFCELWSEFRSSPAQFPAAKHTQLRGYMADLGLTDQRRRPVDQSPDRDEFFDD